MAAIYPSRIVTFESLDAIKASRQSSRRVSVTLLVSLLPVRRISARKYGSHFFFVEGAILLASQNSCQTVSKDCLALLGTNFGKRPASGSGR